MTDRTDAQKLADAIGRVREIGRFQDGDDREPVVVYTSHGDTGLRYIIAQENEESLVLTPHELRWLVNVMFGDPNPIPAWRFWLGNLRWRLSRGWQTMTDRGSGERCLDEFVSSLFGAAPAVFKCDLPLNHPGVWHQQIVGGAPTKWRHSEVHCAECERLQAENEHLREQLKEESALKWSARKARQAGEADND